MNTKELFSISIDERLQVDDLSDLKNRLVHSVLMTCLVIGMLIVIPAVYAAWVDNSFGLIGVYIASYIFLCLIAMLPIKYYNLKAGLLVLLPIFLTVQEFLTYGIASSGTVYAIIAIFLAAALFDLKIGLYVTGFISASMLIIGALVHLGMHSFEPIRLQNSLEFVHWIIRVAQITLTGNLLVLTLRFLVMRINSSLEKSIDLTTSLQSERHRLRRIISAIPGSVLICDNDFSGAVLWSNNVAERDFGLGVPNLVGESIARYFYNEDDFVNVCARVNNRQQVVGEEVQIIRRDNTTFWAHVSGSVIEMATGPVAIYIIQDVDQLRQTQQAMQQMKKMESLGMMAGGIAHDFRNILTAVSSHSNIALRRLDEDAPARKSVVKAIKAADKGADLTKQLLQYAGNKSAEITEIDLNALITENLSLLGEAVPPHVVVTDELDLSLPNIHGDGTQIQQVVMNLIINAAQAMGANEGTIHLDTKRVLLSYDDLVPWQIGGEELRPGAYLQLRIDDTGPGMDAKTLSSIFDPFFTTKKEGTGLGLATVLGIVRGHNGGIRVDSTVGKGTCFWLVFPLPKI